MKLFKLNRLKDNSGQSGIGYIAEGVLLESKKVVVSWFGRVNSIVIFNNLDEMKSINCYNDDTIVEWIKD